MDRERDVIGQERIRVVIFDPHPIYIRGLVEYLAGAPDVVCVGTAATGSDVRAALARAQPNVVIFSSPMAKVDVVDFVREALREYPDVKFLAIGDPDRDAFPTRLICAGLSGYLLKSCDAPELLQALRVVARGKSYFSSSIATAIVERIHRASAAPRRGGNPSLVLTGRESEVLELLATGKSNQSIASVLRVSERTVENHVHNLYRKLGVHDRAHAVRVALRQGYVASFAAERWADGNERLIGRN